MSLSMLLKAARTSSSVCQRSSVNRGETTAAHQETLATSVNNLEHRFKFLHCVLLSWRSLRFLQFVLWLGFCFCLWFRLFSIALIGFLCRAAFTRRAVVFKVIVVRRFRSGLLFLCRRRASRALCLALIDHVTNQRQSSSRILYHMWLITEAAGCLRSFRRSRGRTLGTPNSQTLIKQISISVRRRNALDQSRITKTKEQE